MEKLRDRIRTLERRRSVCKGSAGEPVPVDFDAIEEDVKYGVYREQIKLLTEDFKQERADRTRLKEEVDSLRAVIIKLKEECTRWQRQFWATANNRRKREKLPRYACDCPVDDVEDGRTEDVVGL